MMCCNSFVIVSKYFLFISLITSYCYDEVNGGDIKEDIENNQGYIMIGTELQPPIVGGTLIAKNIMLTTANVIKDEKSKYFGGMCRIKLISDIKAIIAVIYYNYQEEKYNNNFGLLIFPKDMTGKTEIKTATLLKPKENIQNSKSYITGVTLFDDDLDTITVNTMTITNCGNKSKYNQTICNVLEDKDEKCIVSEGGAMFVEINGQGKAPYYAFAGVVVNEGTKGRTEKCNDANNPIVVLRPNNDEVFNWIQIIKTAK